MCKSAKRSRLATGCVKFAAYVALFGTKARKRRGLSYRIDVNPKAAIYLASILKGTDASFLSHRIARRPAVSVMSRNSHDS
jgi:hypothetical protein